MKPSPKVAVVILNWNGRKFLEQFLPSLEPSGNTDCQVIVADNASTDDSIRFLQQYYPQVRIIQLPTNLGFAKGYNEALKQVSADYYMILNSDVELNEGWLEPMLQLLESDRQIAACQPKILSWKERRLFEYAGAAGGWIDRYGYPFSKGRVFDVCEEDQGQYDQSEPIFWASGAALFVRASVFQEMKGFDEYFFAHQEEIDLCWRIQLAGYKIYSCPASVVYHVGGGTLPRGDSQKTFLNFRNNLIMLAKNLPWPRKLWVIPYRFSLDGVTAWRGLLKGDTGYFKAIIRAHFAVIGWIFSGQGKSVFPAKRGGKLAGVFQGNIVWAHFIRKKNTFSKILGKTD